MDYEVSKLAEQLEQEMNPDVMPDEELQGIVGKEIDDAIDFIDNWISPQRATATQYYRGEPFGNEEDGRSQVVSMDVRDTVQALMPSLMRIFHGSDQTVEYVPQGPEDVAAAKQATDYANYIINRDNNGFLEMHSAFMDALVRKVGILKVYWDDQTKFETVSYSGLDDASLAALMSDPAVDVEIVASEPMGEPMQDPLTGEDMPVPMMHAVRATYTHPDGRVKLEAVPPEEFLISRESKSVEQADYVAHRRIVTVSELVAMGYDYDEVSELGASYDDMDTNVERYARNKALTNEMNERHDPAMKKVLDRKSVV